MPKVSLSRITQLLNQELKIAAIPDTSLNGLQVSGTRAVGKVALAVDASLRVIEAAIAAQADLLIVHHGLLWGQSERWVGKIYQKLSKLCVAGMGLYAAHLPLDLHPRLGNNAVLARKIGLKKIVPFGIYHDIKIGFSGSLESAKSLHQIAERLAVITQEQPKIYQNNQQSKIKTIAIVSGGGSDCTEEAILAGFDLFITGENKYINHCLAQENGLNLMIGGHYATETLGVKAIGEYLVKKTGIKSVFLDFPTGF